VHLTGEDIAASDARALAAGRNRNPGKQFLVAVSCHSAAQVRLAEAHGADFAVLAPIFEKVSAGKASAGNSGDEPVTTIRGGIGLDQLRTAARQDRASDARVEAGDLRTGFPVFALGGITRERAAGCAAAGASGIAGIRIFQQAPDLAELVGWLRQL
jgi:thiamine-phosphate pyrophosphorylase